MSVKTTVTCNHCGRDLSSTRNAAGYALRLSPRGIPTEGGIVTLLHVEPEIPGDRDFCGLGCLAAWLAREYPRAAS